MKTTTKFTINILVLTIIASSVLMMVSTTNPSYAYTPLHRYQKVDRSKTNPHETPVPDKPRTKDVRCDCEDELITWEFEMEVRERQMNTRYTLYHQSEGATIATIIDDSIKTGCRVVDGNEDGDTDGLQLSTTYAHFTGEDYIECTTPSLSTINTVLEQKGYGTVGALAHSETPYIFVKFHDMGNNLQPQSEHIPLVYISATNPLPASDPNALIYKMGLSKDSSDQLWSPYFSGLTPLFNIENPFDNYPSYNNSDVRKLHELLAQRTESGRLQFTAKQYNSDQLIVDTNLNSPYEQPVWSTDSQVIRIGYSPDGKNLMGNIQKVVVDPCMVITD